jgi:hypothetical protein
LHFNRKNCLAVDSTHCRSSGVGWTLGAGKNRGDRQLARGRSPAHASWSHRILRRCGMRVDAHADDGAPIARAYSCEALDVSPPLRPLFFTLAMLPLACSPICRADHAASPDKRSAPRAVLPLDDSAWRESAPGMPPGDKYAVISGDPSRSVSFTIGSSCRRAISSHRTHDQRMRISSFCPALS